MQPSFDLRIATMKKALSDTVIPAIDAANKAAIEQAQIVLGSLDLLRDQIEYAHWFEVVDAQSMLALIRELMATARFPCSVVAKAIASEAEKLMVRHDLRLSKQREVNRRLRSVVKTILDESFELDDEGVTKAVSRIVIEHSRIQIGRERAFVSRLGFDVFPDDLLPLEQALIQSTKDARGDGDTRT
jgi:hypothetical protein